MLVLTRKLGERIFIGDAIQLTVLRIGHGNVRLGIDAPRQLAIAREELLRGAASAEGGEAERAAPLALETVGTP